MLLLGEQDFAATGHDSFDANAIVMVTLRQATRMAATTIGSKYEHLKFALATQTLQPPSDRHREHDADGWDRSCLRSLGSGANRPLKARCHRRHDRSLASPLLLLPRHRPLRSEEHTSE